MILNYDIQGFLASLTHNSVWLETEQRAAGSLDKDTVILAYAHALGQSSTSAYADFCTR